MLGVVCKNRRSLLIFAVAMAPSLSHAQWWNIKSLLFERDAKRVETLLVTGNYVKSRMLAEIFQRKTAQPILLLPAPGSSDTLYFLSPEKSLEIAQDDYVRFIEFLQPKKVIFMGNESYTPKSYIKLLGDNFPVWTIRNDDWEKIAGSMGDMFREPKLLFEFLAGLYQLDESGRIKPPASTGEFGGFATEKESWSPPSQRSSSADLPE